ncbi:MAG: hypothetical protein JWN48_5880, partial [Myxococcaceae bacterium]|nr:hypothetical protein [Myxococcaceae bacterium]
IDNVDISVLLPLYRASVQVVPNRIGDETRGDATA